MKKVATNIQRGILWVFVFVNIPLLSQDYASVPIKIQWADSIPGDFTFTQNWSYPLGVSQKSDGKAGCADGGHCPQRCYAMMDANGIVLTDSAEVFYQLLDTNHLFHTLSCKAWCYEWAETDFIHAKRIKHDSIFCYTETGIATHCSLHLSLNRKSCLASIHLNSIRMNGSDTFYCDSGSIRISPYYLKQGILKGSFHFHFRNTTERNKIIFWKGLILSPILEHTEH